MKFENRAAPAPDVESIFAAATELPDNEVGTFLDDACEGNVELKRRVSSLLSAHRKNDQWLESTPTKVTPTDETCSSIGEQVGDKIGRYRLLERIGEGGMGVVYLAEQLDDIHRKVALKIVKLGMDTRQVLARFKAESQALSLFDHPCIARVLDAGTTESGRPYFVMELVEGVGIIEYGRNSDRKLADNLRLFVNVCEAVHHAHQKGIIHRDLKPSNILVSEADSPPTVTVIDFGIAKSVGGDRLTQRTLVTHCEAMLGTPAYMSPEQSSSAPEGIDIRSDVYSLGVVLYELLTGKTPDMSPDHHQSRIINPPPTRIAQPQMKIRRELDWITMKALSFDRKERYASANEFAADIQRFLDEKPVIAAPPAPFYKIRTLLRRHRITFVSFSLAATCLLVLTVACGYFALTAYYANTCLASANANLTKKNLELNNAKQDLSKAFDKHRYYVCFSIASEKFENNCIEEISRIENRIHRQWRREQTSEGIKPRDLRAANYLCFYYDQRMLLELPQEAMESITFQSLKEWQRREDSIYDRVYGSDQFVLAEQQHIHTRHCHSLQQKLRLAVRPFRPRYFKAIANEIEDAFGGQSLQFADALQLLSLACRDSGQLRKADQFAEEARLISSSIDSIETCE